ncbi:hypothetical protein, partial [Actinocorallia lasiicapitis]
ALVLRDAAADRAAVPDPSQQAVWTFGGAAAMLALQVTDGAKPDPARIDALADALSGTAPVPPPDETSTELTRLTEAVRLLRPQDTHEPG